MAVLRTLAAGVCSRLHIRNDKSSQRPDVRSLSALLGQPQRTLGRPHRHHRFRIRGAAHASGKEQHPLAGDTSPSRRALLSDSFRTAFQKSETAQVALASEGCRRQGREGEKRRDETRLQRRPEKIKNRLSRSLVPKTMRCYLTVVRLLHGKSRTI